MIYGVGIDLIEVPRVAEKISRENGFLGKVFSKNEITYCEQRGDARAQHYAARFAAKEAFLKATGQGMLLTYDLNEIEITVNDLGKPELKLVGKLAQIQLKYFWSKIHVSMSHLESTATAVVVIETPDR